MVGLGDLAGRKAEAWGMVWEEDEEGGHGLMDGSDPVWKPGR